MKQIQKTHFGEMICVDSLDALRIRETNSVDLIFTIPPYDMNRKKKYGNKKGDELLKDER
jgi:DNA modification methylase